jgi:hypothetical protein
MSLNSKVAYSNPLLDALASDFPERQIIAHASEPWKDEADPIAIHNAVCLLGLGA